MRLSTHEEYLIRLLRLLDAEQHPDLVGRFVKEVRAQIQANGVSTDILDGRQLRVIGNARVEQTLGLPKRRTVAALPKRASSKPPEKKDDRDDLDPGMDDALG
jgi:hypothetical protein